MQDYEDDTEYCPSLNEIEAEKAMLYLFDVTNWWLSLVDERKNSNKNNKYFKRNARICLMDAIGFASLKQKEKRTEKGAQEKEDGRSACFQECSFSIYFFNTRS